MADQWACVCLGQCGRHEGPCPERSGYQSKIRANYCWLPTIEQRRDGQVWCSICWRVEEERLRTERRKAREADLEQRLADARKQGRLFDG